MDHKNDLYNGSRDRQYFVFQVLKYTVLYYTVDEIFVKT